MVRYIRNILLFFCIIFLVDISCGALFNYLSGHSKGSDTKENYYIANECEADVLIFGSSRAQHHYDTSILSDSLCMSVYNCGLDGCGSILSLGRFLLLTERYTPKIVIVDIFSNYDVNEGDNTKYISTLRRFKHHKCLDGVFNLVSPFEKYKNFSNLYCYNGQVVKLTVDFWKADNSSKQGYIPMCGNIKGDASIEEPEQVYRWDKSKKAALEEIIRICRERQILLLFAMSPYFTGNNDHAYKVVAQFSEDLGVPFLYHFTDSFFARRPEYFADRSHLNEVGAELYSSMIAHEIKEIYSK